MTKIYLHPADVLFAVQIAQKVSAKLKESGFKLGEYTFDTRKDSKRGEVWYEFDGQLLPLFTAQQQSK